MCESSSPSISVPGDTKRLAKNDKAHIVAFAVKPLVLDVVSLKENALDEYEGLLTSLPGVENKIKCLIRRKKHGSNYVYRAYALSAHLWLASEESALVPESVLAFLEPCLGYVNSSQESAR
jgi:hypothetical protein